MRAMRLLRFQPESLAPNRLTPIDRYLDRDDHAVFGHWGLSSATSGMGIVRIALRDTGGPAGVIEPRDDSATIWHLLWVRGEVGTQVSIGDNAWPIAPGDSVVVPPGASLRTDARQLAVEIAVPGAVAQLAPPTHGEERFFGYNRQTTCCRAGDVRVCRWKLTQPLRLADHHPDPVLVLALARDSTIRTSTEVASLRQGELGLIDPATDPIITPDGLSYLLTIDRDPHTG